MGDMKFLTDLTRDEVLSLSERMGVKAYHGKMLYKWVFVLGVSSYEEMTDLPLPFRESLAREYKVKRLEKVKELTSRDGTTKILCRLPDGHCIEMVKIPDGDRLTACISTQVGCGMGCRFCASGLHGLERNLEASEIVEQVLLTATGKRRELTNLVFMGMGEPLMNLDNLSHAILTINRPGGLEFGARRMTVSTVGIPKGIRKLADLRLQINLAISLHAADEAKRGRLIPLAEKVALPEILEAADYYRMQTTRDVTYEVLLLKEVNDGSEDACKLAALLKNRKCMVNLIPFNPVEGLPFKAPDPVYVNQFRRVLEKARIPVTVRKSKGSDIQSACGQLRRSHMK